MPAFAGWFEIPRGASGQRAAWRLARAVSWSGHGGAGALQWERPEDGDSPGEGMREMRGGQITP